MNARLKMAGIALLLATAVTPALAQQTTSERTDLARYQRYAGTPVEQLHYFQINGFEYLAPDQVAVWTGVNKLYLLTVQTPCPDLAFANGIGVTSSNHTLHTNMDFVTFRNRRCKILKITPVDELKMKQDADKAKAAPPPSKP